jgi:hypothetical protein
MWPASIGIATEPMEASAVDRAERDMLVTAMADAAAATNILLGVTHKLLARHTLSLEEVQDIYDFTLLTFEEASGRPAHSLVADVIHVARQRLELQMKFALPGPVGSEDQTVKIV